MILPLPCYPNYQDFQFFYFNPPGTPAHVIPTFQAQTSLPVIGSFCFPVKDNPLLPPLRSPGVEILRGGFLVVCSETGSQVPSLALLRSEGLF